MTEMRWRFFRAGGVEQVQITRGAELAALGELDKKLWVALACPVRGVEFDRRTLELIDTDGDGRVRARELIAACAWAAGALRDTEQLARGGASLPLGAIDDTTDEGRALARTARALLDSLGQTDSETISIDEADRAVDAFHRQAFNGDGVVPPSAIDDETLRASAEEVLSSVETPAVDRSGDPGITEADVDAFFDSVEKHAAWLEEGRGEGVMVMGETTEAAWSALEAVRGKVDDWFARVRVAAYDERALEAVNREQSEYLALAARDLHISVEELRDFPLARVTGDGPLPLRSGLNPAWAQAMETFRSAVVEPLYGPVDALTADRWTEVCERFAGWSTWKSAALGTFVSGLDAARVAELAASDHRASLKGWIARDAERRVEAESIEGVRKLVRFCRDLMPLANHFVSFRDFYGRRAPGMFQVGTLYIDRRACELCVDVTDAARHATLAVHSNAYLLYCDLKRAGGTPRSIAAVVSDGDVDNLMVGRNGVFYDREGNEWDATVTRIVDNPISVRQAFWSPYKKAVRAIESQVQRRAQAAEARADEKMTSAMTSAEQAASGTPEATAAPKRLDIGVVAAIGVGIGGMVTALGLLLEAFFGLGLWMPLGFFGLVLLISGPSMAIAWLKLRTRNLGPLLDANGWAVNAMARVNVPLGKSLTQVATVPRDAERDLVDPYADRKRPWLLGLVVAFVLALGAWYLGALDRFVPEGVRSVSVLGEAAPATMRAEARLAAEEAEEAEAAAAAAAEGSAEEPGGEEPGGE